jgi:hypothetical protein
MVALELIVNPQDSTFVDGSAIPPNGTNDLPNLVNAVRSIISSRGTSIDAEVCLRDE